jgi:hypothetical protein
VFIRKSSSSLEIVSERGAYYERERARERLVKLTARGHVADKLISIIIDTSIVFVLIKSIALFYSRTATIGKRAKPVTSGGKTDRDSRPVLFLRHRSFCLSHWLQNWTCFRTNSLTIGAGRSRSYALTSFQRAIRSFGLCRKQLTRSG